VTFGAVDRIDENRIEADFCDYAADIVCCLLQHAVEPGMCSSRSPPVCLSNDPAAHESLRLK